MTESNRIIVNTNNVKPYRSPRQKRQILVFLIVIAIIIALGVAAFFIFMPRQESYLLSDYNTAIVTQGNLVTTTQASGTVVIPLTLNLLSPEQGYADELYVQEGDTVQKGQILAKITVPDLQEQLEDLEAELTDARLNLQKSQKQNEYTLAQLKRQIESLTGDIAQAQEEVENKKELVEINASRQDELDTALDTLEDLESQKLEKELELENQIDIQQIDLEIKETAIEQLETRFDRINKRIKACSIKSPMSGEILEKEATLGVPGSMISANQYLFNIADPQSALIELEVDEEYADLLTIDQTVAVTVGNKNLEGKITSIGKVAAMSSDGLGATITVKVKPVSYDGTSFDGSLLQGSTAVGTFELGTKSDALLLPRGPYLTTGSQRYLYLVDGNQAKRVEVTFGQIQGNQVEILNGVEAGSTVIISGYQNFIEHEIIQLKKGE